MRAIQGDLSTAARATALLAVAAACVALLLVTAGGPPASAAPGAPGATASKSVRVKIRGFKYKPPTVKVKRGTRVVWVNRDRAPHTATRRGSFDTGTIGSGRAVAVRFKRRGAYRYICTIHPQMRGKVVVR